MLFNKFRIIECIIYTEKNNLNISFSNVPTKVDIKYTS